jgi:hypothetical protein
VLSARALPRHRPPLDSTRRRTRKRARTAQAPVHVLGRLGSRRAGAACGRQGPQGCLGDSSRRQGRGPPLAADDGACRNSRCAHRRYSADERTFRTDRAAARGARRRPVRLLAEAEPCRDASRSSSLTRTGLASALSEVTSSFRRGAVGRTAIAPPRRRRRSAPCWCPPRPLKFGPAPPYRRARSRGSRRAGCRSRPPASGPGAARRAGRCRAPTRAAAPCSLRRDLAAGPGPTQPGSCPACDTTPEPAPVASIPRGHPATFA